jgi:hypothetical protein
MEVGILICPLQLIDFARRFLAAASVNKKMIAHLNMLLTSKPYLKTPRK